MKLRMSVMRKLKVINNVDLVRYSLEVSCVRPQDAGRWVEEVSRGWIDLVKDPEGARSSLVHRPVLAGPGM